MTQHKNDESNREGANQTPQARGGVIIEDRAKDADPERSNGPFGEKKEGQEGQAAAESKKTSG
jgi:hypothetical protein